jgi:hypothetical protein
VSKNDGVHDEDVTPGAPTAPSPHPLAERLASRLAASGALARVLIVGGGNGRNVPPLLAAGARIDLLEEDGPRARDLSARFAAEPRVRIVRGRYGGPIPFAGSFDAALSTHALLHGTRTSVGAAVAAVRNRLASGAPFALTLGSVADPRYGAGRQVDVDAYAPLDGSERGVVHAYFNEAGVRALLDGFALESLDERGAAESAGRWAHSDLEAERIVHWFAWARRL